MRLTRHLVQALTGLLILVGMAAGAAMFALRAPPLEREARQRLTALLAAATGARVSIGRLGGSLLFGVQADDVRLVFPAGARVTAAELTASFALPALLGSRIDVGAVRLRGVRVRLVPTAPAWGFDDLTGDETETVVPTVSVRRVVVEDGRVVVTPWRVALTDMRLDTALALTPDTIRIAVDHLSGVPRGIRISPLDARGVVTVASDGGRLDLEHLELTSRRTRLAGDARIDFERSVRLHLAAAPLSARELRALVDGIGLRTDVTGALDARGPWRRIAVRSAIQTPQSGAVRLFGVLDAGGSDLPYHARGRLRNLDLAAVDRTLPAADVTARVDARGALATLDAPPLAFQLDLDPSTIAGTRLDGARLAGHLTASRIDARGTISIPGARAAIDGGLGWTGEQPFHAEVRAHIAELATLAPGVSGHGGVRATIDGRGLAGPGRTARAQVRLEGGDVAGVRFDDGTASLALRGEELALESATVTRRDVRADASGTLDLQRGSLAGAVTASGSLSSVAPGDVAGGFAARATVRGALSALAIDGTATAERIRSGTTSIDRAVLGVAVHGVGGEAPGGRTALEVSGLHGGDTAPWTGSATIDWQRTAGTDAADVRASGRSDAGSQLATRATVRRTAAGDIAADLHELTVAPAEEPTWSLVGPARLTRTAGGISVDRLALTAGQQRLTVAGRVGTSGPLDASLEWHEVDLEALCRLRGLTCAGHTAGTARLAGTAAEPRVSLAARADDVAVEGSPVTAITLGGEYLDRALALRGTLTQPEAGRLDIDGRVPVDLAWDGGRSDRPTAPIDLRVRTDGLDLRVARLAAPDAIREIGGQLVADLHLTGTWDALRANGSLGLRDGRLGLAATGVTYEDIAVEATARGETIEVQQVRARGGDGSVEGAGTMALLASRTTPFAVELRLRNFLAVSQPGYDAATDGTLRIEGALAYPVVRGDLVLTHLLVRPTVLTQTSGPSLEPDPTIEVVGLPADAAPRAPAAPPIDVADALSLDVMIRIVRDAWIRRSDADVELRGEVRLGKAAHRPLFVTGEYRLVRGQYAFQGRRFDVDEGRIILGGEVPPDPQLDITAVNKTGDYEITVRISGRASEPTLALSSSPPLEQADILALLVFGRPARDLGRQEGLDLQRQAISLASGYVMPELRQSVMNTLGLDTLEVGDQGVRAGRYVTRDVFVTLAQDFTGRAGQTMGAEYSVTRRLSIKLSTSTQGTSAVDLLWRRRY